MAGVNLEGSMDERAGRDHKGSGAGIFSILEARTLDGLTANSGSVLTLPISATSTEDEVSTA